LRSARVAAWETSEVIGRSTGTTFAQSPGRANFVTVRRHLSMTDPRPARSPSRVVGVGASAGGLDILFRSLTNERGARRVAVRLPDGTDGSRGVRDVHNAGGSRARSRAWSSRSST